MKSYSTLIVDAFDTLLYINRQKLFPHAFGDKTIHTTAPRVHEAYERAAGPIAFETFVDAFIGSWRKTNELRESGFREIPSTERFRLMLDLLDERHGDESLPGILTEAHMRHLAPALDIPRSHREVLVEARRAGFRLAMISNFDYSPTLERCLVAHGVRNLFDAVVVSDEVGWRKPHPEIFEHAFRMLDVTADESLFVGDRLELDVAGAHGVGMDVVWIDSGAEAWTPEFGEPLFRISTLAQLPPILDRLQSGTTPGV